MNAFKISSRTNQNSAAGYIARHIEQSGMAGEPQEIELQAIGPQATYKAVRAAAKAVEVMASKGVDLICIPGFLTKVIDDKVQTAIRITVRKG